MATATFLSPDGRLLRPNLAPVYGVPKPWVVVAEAGMFNELVVGEYATFPEALRVQRLCSEASVDIMKRSSDGTLTTEY